MHTCSTFSLRNVLKHSSVIKQQQQTLPIFLFTTFFIEVKVGCTRVALGVSLVGSFYD